MKAGPRTGARLAHTARSWVGAGTVPCLPGGPGRAHDQGDVRPGGHVSHPDRRESAVNRGGRRACRTVTPLSRGHAAMTGRVSSAGAVQHRAAASRTGRSGPLVQPEPIRTAAIRAANTVMPRGQKCGVPSLRRRWLPRASCLWSCEQSRRIRRNRSAHAAAGLG
jgi:hypothetical protein